MKTAWIGSSSWNFKRVPAAITCGLSLSLLVLAGCTSGASPPTRPGASGPLPPEFHHTRPPSEGEDPQGEKDFWAKVIRVIDGATLSLESLHVVRLIGVLPPHGAGQDTYAAFFDEVTTPAVRNILEGKRVRIFRDKVGHDREGRPLVYIFTEDGSQLNATLIQKGFARVSLEVPFKLQDEFKLWEQEAKEVGIGLWGRTDARP